MDFITFLSVHGGVDFNKQKWKMEKLDFPSSPLTSCFNFSLMTHDVEQMSEFNPSVILVSRNEERGGKIQIHSQAFNAISEMENRTNRIQFPSKCGLIGLAASVRRRKIINEI
jgi:hypothetical protein